VYTSTCDSDTKEEVRYGKVMMAAPGPYESGVQYLEKKEYMSVDQKKKRK
jgi:hypothetical protein